MNAEEMREAENSALLRFCTRCRHYALHKEKRRGRASGYCSLHGGDVAIRHTCFHWEAKSDER